MNVKQSDLCKKWRVSKGIVSRYVSRGMPLTSAAAAEHWILVNIRTNKIAFPHPDSQKRR